MSNVVLIDGNNLANRLFLSQAIQSKSDIAEAYDLWAYLMFTNTIGYADSHTKRIVFAVDGQYGSWRKIAYKPYKANRAGKRDASDIDWESFFKCYKKLINKLKTNTSIKVIELDRIEADDVIGAISINADNDVAKKIITADSDYKQLIRKNVSVYDPMKGEYMVCDNVEHWINEQCLIGQKKDNIYNIMTPDDWGLTPETEGKRKPGFGPAAAQKIFDYGLDKWLSEDEVRMKRYKVNKFLIDLRYIPKEIVNAILTAYNETESYDKDSVDLMIQEYGWHSLMASLNEENNKNVHAILSRIK